MDRSVLFLSPADGVPAVSTPFSVLLDAHDAEWGNGESLVRLGQALLNAGCRYFVCFGSESEQLHDRIDDLIIDGAYDGVITTWHNDESKVDVAEFFQVAARSAGRGAVALVRDAEGWKHAFSAIPRDK